MTLVLNNPRVGIIYRFTRAFQALNNIIIAKQQYAGDTFSFIAGT